MIIWDNLIYYFLIFNFSSFFLIFLIFFSWVPESLFCETLYDLSTGLTLGLFAVTLPPPFKVYICFLFSKFEFSFFFFLFSSFFP